ncbi:MAG: response regulator [Hyphomonadaceae bacterium]
MGASEPDKKIDLSKASFLVVDASVHSLEIVMQMLRGFGVHAVSTASTIEAAQKLCGAKTFDLIIIDPGIEDGSGYSFVIDLRKSGAQNAFCPVILCSGHVRQSDVSKGRNTGANFVIAKPMAATVLLQRIMWVARDKRPFVEIGNYIGPDRRFKFEGPPPDSEGRRQTDLKSPLGDAQEPNLSNDEIDAMFKPQRVII